MKRLLWAASIAFARVVISDCNDVNLRLFWLQDSTLWNHDIIQKLMLSNTRVIKELMTRLSSFASSDAKITSLEIAFGQYADKPGPVTGSQTALYEYTHVGTVLNNGQRVGAYWPDAKRDDRRYKDIKLSKPAVQPKGRYFVNEYFRDDWEWHWHIQGATQLDDKPYIWIQPFTSDPIVADVFARKMTIPSTQDRVTEFSSYDGGPPLDRFLIPQTGGDYQNNQWEANLCAMNDPKMRAGWAFNEPNTIRILLNVSASFAHKDVPPCDFKDPSTMSPEMKDTCQPPNYNAEFHPLFLMGPHSYGQPWCREDRSYVPLHHEKEFVDPNNQDDMVEVDEPSFSMKDTFVCSDPWSQHKDYKAPPRQEEFPWGAAGPSTGSMNNLKSIQHYMDVYLYADAYPNYLYNTMDYQLRKHLMMQNVCCSGMDAWYRGTGHFGLECIEGRNQLYDVWMPEASHFDHTNWFQYNGWWTHCPHMDSKDSWVRYVIEKPDCKLCTLHGGLKTGSIARFNQPYNIKKEQCCWQDAESSLWMGRWKFDQCPDVANYDTWRPSRADGYPQRRELEERFSNLMGDAEILTLDKYTTHALNALAADPSVALRNVISPFDYTFTDSMYDVSTSYTDYGKGQIRRGSQEWWINHYNLVHDWSDSYWDLDGKRYHEYSGTNVTEPYINADISDIAYKARQVEYPNPFDEQYASQFIDRNVQLVHISVAPTGNWSEYIVDTAPYNRQNWRENTLAAHDKWQWDPFDTGEAPPVSGNSYFPGSTFSNYYKWDLGNAVTDYFKDVQAILDMGWSDSSQILQPKRGYDDWRRFGPNKAGPEDASWRGVPVLLAAAHSCPNLRNDPFTIYSCTRVINANMCPRELPAGSKYESFQNKDAIKKCRDLGGEQIGGCRRDPYSFNYPPQRSGFKYNDIFESPMLWKQHDGDTQNNTPLTQKWPAQSIMRQAQYCTSTGDPSLDPWGNPCPADLCDCSKEITDFDTSLHEFFPGGRYGSPFFKAELQRQWWSDCYDYEYLRPIDKINEHNDRLGPPGKWHPRIARHGHVSNLRSNSGLTDLEIVDRLLDEIVKQVSDIVDDIEECRKPPTAVPPTNTPYPTMPTPPPTTTTHAPPQTAAPPTQTPYATMPTPVPPQTAEPPTQTPYATLPAPVTTSPAPATTTLAPVTFAPTTTLPPPGVQVLVITPIASLVALLGILFACISTNFDWGIQEKQQEHFHGVTYGEVERDRAR